jgi:DNA-binding XRE family transcriptional regulator
MNLSQPTPDAPLEERLCGGGPMMEFDPDSDVQDYLRSTSRLTSTGASPTMGAVTRSTPDEGAPDVTTTILRFDGDALRAARSAKGMTQTLLAGLAGVGELAVQRAEAGTHEPLGRTAAAWARILEVDLDGFYRDATDEEKSAA